VQRFAWRQVVIAGLALLLLGSLGRVVAMNRAIAAVQSRLTESGRWLKGVVVVVDPGHGGDDPGAVVAGTKEKYLVLDIAKALKQMLEEQGARVILTRDADVDLGGRTREELGKRVAMVGQHRAQTYVSIHANKDGCKCWGAQTFYAKHGGRPEGKQLAVAIQQRLRQMTPTTREALPADLFVLRESPVPSAMVEVGFLTDGAERQRLQDPLYQHKLATAVALGLADFFRSQVPQTRSHGQVGQ